MAPIDSFRVVELTHAAPRNSAARFAGIMLAGLALLCASSSQATQVVDVRVGRHAGFTRLVFELDAPAGYRIERHAPAPGIAELVVSLEASASPRSIATPNSLLSGIEIAPAGRGAVAHIRLTRSGLRLKEMILANPPRIVLDVLSGEPVAAAPKSKSKPAVKAPATSPKKPGVSGVSSDAKPLAEVTAPTQDPTPARAPVPPTSSGPSAAVRAPAGVPGASAGPDEVPDPRVQASAPSAPGELAPAEIPSAQPVPVPVPIPRPSAAPARSAQLPKFPTRPGSGLSPTDARQPSEGSLLSARNLAYAAIGLVAVAGAVVFVRRRRADGMDDDVFDDEAPGDNPFAEPESAEATEPAYHATEPAYRALDPDAPADPTGTADLFGSDDAVPGAGMSASQSIEVPAVAETEFEKPDPPEYGGDDLLRQLREVELRLASLEGRLDNVADGGERLDRQVSAQTEELRVQRAAIARTQRAVRNLSRPDEDAPAEPGMPDPRGPVGSPDDA